MVSLGCGLVRLASFSSLFICPNVHERAIKLKEVRVEERRGCNTIKNNRAKNARRLGLSSKIESVSTPK